MQLRLYETARSQFEFMLEQAEAGLNTMLRQCEWYDTSTWRGVMGKAACVSGAYAVYATATTAASTAYGIAYAAVAGTVEAFHIGELGGCLIVKDAGLRGCAFDRDVCRSAHYQIEQECACEYGN
jgi:hypothetical protein